MCNSVPVDRHVELQNNPKYILLLDAQKSFNYKGVEKHCKDSKICSDIEI